MEFLGKSKAPDEPKQEWPAGNALRVGLVDGAVTAKDAAALVALFPNITFESVGAVWPEQYARKIDILIVGLDASAPDEIAAAIRRLNVRPAWPQILVMLRNADVSNSRALTRAGAADVLPMPVSEAALALCIERLLSRETSDRYPARRPGQVVALLKAGGGVGATSLGVQAAHLLSERAREPGRVCFADLDLQFGAAALYFDLEEALTITDCIAVGEVLGETQFATALAAHKSGVRFLAGPRELTTLEALSPQLTEALVSGLKRDFPLTIIDLPSVWTAWTNRVLQMADRIVLVTGLSVLHVHLVRRQLQVLSMQQLAGLPLTLVCNRMTSDQQKLLSVKSAERAIGRSFDIQIPYDEGTMGAATNQGVTLAAVRRNTKLEKAVGLVADTLAADARVSSPGLR